MTESYGRQLYLACIVSAWKQLVCEACPRNPEVQYFDDPDLTDRETNIAAPTRQTALNQAILPFGDLHGARATIDRQREHVSQNINRGAYRAVVRLTE
jgi:hypothetical protein